MYGTVHNVKVHKVGENIFEENSLKTKFRQALKQNNQTFKIYSPEIWLEILPPTRPAQVGKKRVENLDLYF